MSKVSLIAALCLVCSTTAFSAPITQAPRVEVPSTAQPSAAQRVSQLSYTAQDKNATISERVTALNELANFPSQNALVAVARGLSSEHKEIRLAAVEASTPYQLSYRWRLVSPLLADKDQDLRFAAAINLSKEFSKLDTPEQTSLSPVLAELTSVLKTSESLEADLLLANIYRWTGDFENAQPLYQKLANDHPEYSADVWLHYADNYRAKSNDQQALKVLDEGLVYFKQDENLLYSKALTLVRLDNKPQAAISMQLAANKAKTNSYFWYLNGVLQEPIDMAQSVTSFEQAYLLSGAPEQLYALCDIYIKSGSDKTEQCLAQLSEIAPPKVVAQLKSQE
ncbi:hypothetical protein [Vibrio sp. SCSIO 43136]|uniref:hypothetical protein n=1 Tax=Vibrio sp. SCSIO 43136 TaxID=2819101 RepID=UPI002074D2E5|nr:hypothetical protein [Vibrio sp. SCSIO 43136]USD64263.1 hypothetical protein J4N39_09085 [Vibrio sp. SCSIO 43136]